MTNGDITLRGVRETDAAAIVAIYNPYICDSIFTFEEAEVSSGKMAARIQSVVSSYPWLVAERDGKVVGYAYASRYHERAAYRRTATIGVYVATGLHHAGIGTMLYRAVLDKLHAMDFHAVIALITVPNPASIALHEKCGFQKVGHLPQVGFKFGQWVDVGIWQLTFP